MVESVCKEDVFELLGKNIFVYAFNPIDDELIDLYYETVRTILDYLESDKYVYFVVIKKEGKK
jgi:hypothetical protein